MQNSYIIGSHDTRPWGKWTSLDAGNGYAVKRIEVNPGEILSLQRHNYRGEHWTITSGNGIVTSGDKKISVAFNSSVYIPVGDWHRIENTGNTVLTFIEVQVGENLDENDIERSDDKYSRK